MLQWELDGEGMNWDPPPPQCPVLGIGNTISFHGFHTVQASVWKEILRTAWVDQVSMARAGVTQYVQNIQEQTDQIVPIVNQHMQGAQVTKLFIHSVLPWKPLKKWIEPTPCYELICPQNHHGIPWSKMERRTGELVAGEVGTRPNSPGSAWHYKPSQDGNPTAALLRPRGPLPPHRRRSSQDATRWHNR